MQSSTLILNQPQSAKPWYAHRWPWLLMVGPVAVILAGILTTWIAFSTPDALVVDDYYKQGKAINMDLRRDRVAASLKLQLNMRYDAGAGKLNGTIDSLDQSQTERIFIKLVHSTQPAKDIQLATYVDRQGNFSVALPMLEIANWQVMVENERRDWRLHGTWRWPQQREIDIKAATTSAE